MAVDEAVWGRPATPLRPYVAHYSGYRQRDVPPATHRGLPSPYLTLILTLDDPRVVEQHPDRRQAPARYDALVGGLHLGPALITHDGRQSGVQVAVHPLACRALLGLPAGELAGVDTDLAAVLGATTADELRGRLLAAATWPARFAALDTALLRLALGDRTLGDRALGERSLDRRGSGKRGLGDRGLGDRSLGDRSLGDRGLASGGLRAGDLGAGRRAEVHPDVVHVHRRLLATGGRLRIGTLAGEVGWSARHLTNRFRAEVGLGPKEVARVVRFDRARRRLDPEVRLADLAAATGFYDQAHLSREFQALAGCSPSRWLADEIGFVQASRAAGAHDVGHD